FIPMEGVVAVEVGAPLGLVGAAVIAVGVLKPGEAVTVHLPVAIGVGDGEDVDSAAVEEEGYVRVHAVGLGKEKDVAPEHFRSGNVAWALPGEEEDGGLGARCRVVGEL